MQSGQQWRGLSKAALPSAAALLEVFRSAEAYLKRGNSAGCVLQLVRVTVAAAEEPLKFGIGHGGEFRQIAAPGSLRCEWLEITGPVSEGAREGAVPHCSARTRLNAETAASVWAAAGGTSVCVSATEFPQVSWRLCLHIPM